jgi:hypothetical protein
LAEWLIEEGIGETRAILVEQDRIVEAALELPGELRAGAVLSARLAKIQTPGRRALAALEGGGEALVEPLPSALTEGQAIRVEILRETIAEPGRVKLAKGRVTDEAPRSGPSLAQRLGRARPSPVPGPDLFEAYGWSELVDEALTGEIAFPGGSLRMSLTPAMTLFDVDGGLPPDELAVAGAAAAARAIRRFGLGGSIGIDLPTLAAKADRQAAAAALDALLPQPFERTAVNGFGFLQLVRRRERASLPEILQSDPVGAAARALLRQAERAPGAGPVTLRAAPAVTARIAANPQWLEELARRLGAAPSLQPDAALAISAGHAQRHFA